MRRVWFWAIALFSFLFVVGESLLRKAIAVSLCGILSFNSTLCYANLAKDSGESAIAALPPSEQIQNIAMDNTISNGSNQVTINCDKPPNVYAFYVNGIFTNFQDYVNNQLLIDKLLAQAGSKGSLQSYSYNPTGIPIPLLDPLRIEGLGSSADIVELIRQTFSSSPLSSENESVISGIINQINSIESQHQSVSEEKSCKCDISRPKYLLIGYSQGTIFIEQVASRLEREVAERTSLLAIAPLTDYRQARTKIRGLDYLLRQDDISFLLANPELFVNLGLYSSPLQIFKNPGPPNLPSLSATENSKQPNPLLPPPSGGPSPAGVPRNPPLSNEGLAKLIQAGISHKLQNYLGVPSSPEHSFAARIALNLAVGQLTELLNFDSGKYEKKKDKDCDEKPKPQDGETWGDPHLVTFDGIKYDHHAVGEFILAKSTDGNFEIQVREASVPSSSQVALNTAAAMKVGNTRVAFYVKDFPDSDTTNPLRVDGKPTVIQGGSLSLPGGGSITQVNQGSYIVEWTTGERVGVKVDNFGSSALLDINPTLPQTRQGQLIGLLGNFNGNPDDDLKSRDGKVLPPQSTINQVSQITQNLTNWVPIPLNQVESLFLEQLHKQFGDSWRISQQESLFDYAPGKNTESYTNRAFPNGFQVLRMLLPAQVQAAEAACRQAGVPSERLEGCLFDVGVTGNADFAKVAANALTNIVRDRIQNEIQQRIPVPVKIPGLPF